MTSLVCPACSEPLDFAGQAAHCPRCGHALVGDSPATEALDAQASGPPPVFSSLPPTFKSERVTKITRGGQTRLEIPPVPGMSSADLAKCERTLTWGGGQATPVVSDEDAELTSFLAPPQEADELGRLGRYRIRKILRDGGMRVVFHAEDLMLH